MKQFKIYVGGEEIYWLDEADSVWGGFDPASIVIEVDNKNINVDNIYFRNVGYVDFNSDVDFKNDNPNYIKSWYEGIIKDRYFDWDNLEICYGKVKLNGLTTSIVVISHITYKDKIIELEMC